MKPVAAIVLALVVSGWTVTHERDRMTDKQLTWASARSEGATLLVGCLNGSVQPRLTWDRRIGWGDVGASFRMDNGPVVPRMAPVSQSGDTLYLWPMDHAAAVARLGKAKRLRVSIGRAVYDFDLTAGDPLPRNGWGC